MTYLQKKIQGGNCTRIVDCLLALKSYSNSKEGPESSTLVFHTPENSQEQIQLQEQSNDSPETS